MISLRAEKKLPQKTCSKSSEGASLRFARSEAAKDCWPPRGRGQCGASAVRLAISVIRTPSDLETTLKVLAGTGLLGEASCVPRPIGAEGDDKILVIHRIPELLLPGFPQVRAHG